MLEPPGFSATPIDFAEWLELTALSRPNLTSGEGDLRSVLLGGPDDLAAYDGDSEALEEAAESMVQAVFEELEKRSRWAGLGYPFVIMGGSTITTRKGFRLRELAYLLSLLVSLYKSLSKELRQSFPSADQLEDLFQACGTIAAAGFVLGSSLNFGFPRADGTSIYQKLKTLNELNNEGRVHLGWTEGVSTRPKDAGVDIIAWRTCPDKYPGQLYVLGQCATGVNWQDDKAPVVDYNKFHEDFWARAPHSPVISLTLVPYDLRSSISQSLYDSLEEAYKWHRWSLGSAFGIVIDRFRLAYYFSRGLLLTREHSLTVEGVSELMQVRNWVRGGIEYIRINAS